MILRDLSNMPAVSALAGTGGDAGWPFEGIVTVQSISSL